MDQIDCQILRIEILVALTKFRAKINSNMAKITSIKIITGNASESVNTNLPCVIHTYLGVLPK